MLISHIEHKFQGYDRLTLHNTVRNRLASKNISLVRRVTSQTKLATARRVSFNDKATMIDDGVEVDITFEPRKKRHVGRAFAVLDPNATPFLDRFKKSKA